YAYHVKSNGWSDIGYNFLVDRFGTVWEGRAGGITRAVIGAHAGGFNTGTVGISMIGTYETDRPSAAMLESVAQVAGWKLGGAGVDPHSSVTLTSAGSTRWPSGTPVTLPRIFPHRAVSTTSCPGTQGMAALPGLRDRAAALAAGAAPMTPVEESDETLRVDAPATAAAGTTADVVVHGVPGHGLQLWFAGADASAGASLRREGVFDENGSYRTSFTADSTQVLFAVSDGRSSARVRTQVGTGTPTRSLSPSPLAVSGPVTAEPDAEVLVTVTGPPGTGVSVWFRLHDEQAFVRRREGTLGPDGTWTTTYVAAEPLDYFAMSSTVTSADATTGIGPVPNGLHVTVPATGAGGVEVPVVVQGTPGLPVELWFSRAGGPFTRRREGVLAADGTYRTSWASQDAHTLYAVAGGRTSTRVTTQIPGSVPYTPAANDAGPSLVASVPAGVDAGAPVALTVTGRPGAAVAVWFKPRGEAVFTRRRTGVLDAEGTYRSTFTGADDQELFATTGGTASADAGTVVRPVLAAPGKAPLGTVVLTGRARPGDAVVVEQRRRASGSVVRLTATATSSGAFRLTAPFGDESDFRPSVGARHGLAWTTTKVSPVLVAPATSGRGSTLRLSGTARPGAVVEVLVRAQGATAFVVARTLRADAAGRFATTAVLGVSHRAYARADGLASGQRIITVR
ncbi:MAG: cspA, partial [Frankiales bacterium]|nr:cspA [Frankiales bacterium]